MGHGREREVGDGRRGIGKGGEMGKVSTYLDSMYYGCIRVVTYDNVHMYHSNSQLTA